MAMLSMRLGCCSRADTNTIFGDVDCLGEVNTLVERRRTFQGMEVSVDDPRSEGIRLGLAPTSMLVMTVMRYTGTGSCDGMSYDGRVGMEKSKASKSRLMSTKRIPRKTIHPEQRGYFTLDMYDHARFQVLQRARVYSAA
jgi:hypothetical protein